MSKRIYTDNQEVYEKMLHIANHSVQFSSLTQSCLTLCDPMNCSTPGLPVHQQLPELTQTHIHPVSDAIESVMPSRHLILRRPLLLLPPIPPSIRVFPNESTLCMKWPKYWSFSFSIIPSKEIPGPISFRIICPFKNYFYFIYFWPCTWLAGT